MGRVGAGSGVGQIEVDGGTPRARRTDEMTADSPSRSSPPSVASRLSSRRASRTPQATAQKSRCPAGSSRERQLGLVARELRSRRDRPSATQSPKDRHKGERRIRIRRSRGRRGRGHLAPASPPFSEPATPYAKSNGRETHPLFTHCASRRRPRVPPVARPVLPSCGCVHRRFDVPRAPRDAPLTAGLFPRVAACGSRHTHVVIQGRTPVVSSRTVGTRSNSGCCLTTRQAVTRRAGGRVVPRGVPRSTQHASRDGKQTSGVCFVRSARWRPRQPANRGVRRRASSRGSMTTSLACRACRSTVLTTPSRAPSPRSARPRLPQTWPTRRRTRPPGPPRPNPPRRRTS